MMASHSKTGQTKKEVTKDRCRRLLYITAMSGPLFEVSK